MMEHTLNINCSYRFLELLKYKLLSNSSIPQDAANTITIKNEMGVDLQIVVAELKDINTRTNAHKHMSVMDTVTLSSGETHEHLIKTANAYGVVTIKDLQAITEIHNYSRSYGQQNASVDRIPVHYESEASLVLNEEST